MIERLKLAVPWHRLGIKRLLLIIILLGMLVMPGDVLHLLAVIIHTVYESIAFVLEEFLVHSAGFSKFQAQMIVFYTSFVIGMLGVIVLIRRIPKLLASVMGRVSQGYAEVRTDLMNTWQTLSARRKIALLMVQFVGIASMMAFALA